MPRKKKSWIEKLHDAKGLPKTVTIDEMWAKRWGTRAGDTCFIPAPLEVDAVMRKVPRGRLATINELRAALAKAHGTTIACPITTGIFAWIAAHAAEEAAAASGVKSPRITPYWRTLKSDGELNPKYPGGVGALARKLRAEGHTVKKKGQRYFVAGYKRVLALL
jgi:hypothetical protein